MPGHCAPGSKRRLLLCENHLVTTYNTIKRSPASRTGYKVNVGRVYTSVCAYYNKRTKSAVFRKFFCVDYLFCFFLFFSRWFPFPEGHRRPVLRIWINGRVHLNTSTHTQGDRNRMLRRSRFESLFIYCCFPDKFDRIRKSDVKFRTVR